MNDWKRNADAERQAYYDKFDRAVGLLPEADRRRASLHTSALSPNGTWDLRTGSGVLLKQVRDPDVPEPAAKPPKPAGVSSLDACERRLRALEQLYQSMPELIGGAIGMGIRESMAPILERIDGLEAKAKIDDALADELAKCLERIDEIESRGFRFVGKYQAPAGYKRGDVVSYKEALWHCVQDAKTGERPNTASHKWALMLAGEQE